MDLNKENNHNLINCGSAEPNINVNTDNFKDTL